MGCDGAWREGWRGMTEGERSCFLVEEAIEILHLEGIPGSFSSMAVVEKYKSFSRVSCNTFQFREELLQFVFMVEIVISFRDRCIEPIGVSDEVISIILQYVSLIKLYCRYTSTF